MPAASGTPFTSTARPVSYPIGADATDASMFIRDAAKVLGDSKTSIYIDTSFLMWLTKGGADSRQQFLNWAHAIGPRIHVPVWTYHEYYRHHNRDTLRTALANEAQKLKEAAQRYADIARTYADDSLTPGLTANAFDRELDEMVGKIKGVTATGTRWNYDQPAKQLSTWMSERLCRSKVVFELMNKLGELGEARYTQDLPPGYMDRVKVDTPVKGSNKFGDLIMWEEIIAHVSESVTNSVVVLTRDRKEDWFARTSEPEIADELRRLTPNQRWKSVPTPHPTLLIELRERTQATELILLDSLYLGAVLHNVDNDKFSRFIGYALNARSPKFSISPSETALDDKVLPIRPVSPQLSKSEARNLCTSLTLQLSDLQISGTVAAIRARLIGEPPMTEAFVANFSAKEIEALPLADAAAFARLVSEDALADSGHAAWQMSEKLLELLATLVSKHAGAVYAGMLTSAYFDATGPRAIPKSRVLQELFKQLKDPAFQHVLESLGKILKGVGSQALFIPDANVQQFAVRITHDSRQEQTPLVLHQIAFGTRNLLAEIGPALPSNLRKILRGQDSVSIKELLEIVASHYGLPNNLLDPVGAGLEDTRTIPLVLGFESPFDIGGLADTSEMPSDVELSAAAIEDLPGEDTLDPQSILMD